MDHRSEGLGFAWTICMSGVRRPTLCDNCIYRYSIFHDEGSQAGK